MLKIIKKIALLLNAAMVFGYVKIALGASAPGSRLKNIAGKAGYNENLNQSTQGIIMAIIIYALGLLGIIFLGLIITAGLQWMTAGGNEEKVTKAQDRLRNAVIGFIIVMISYAATLFLTRLLDQATVQQNYGYN